MKIELDIEELSKLPFLYKDTVKNIRKEKIENKRNEHMRGVNKK